MKKAKKTLIKTFASEEELLSTAKRLYNSSLNDCFYFIDLTSLESQYKKFKEFLPRVTPHYAMKCNNDPMIIKTLYSLGCGFDCASKGELEQIRTELNVKPDRIVFANPCKMISHIQYAKEINVKRTTFDCIDELNKIKQYYPEAEVIIRIATHDKKSKCPLSIVYGAHKSKWELLIKTCKEFELNLIGLSFHIGSGSSDALNFEDAIQNSSYVFEIAERYGFEMTLLDIGGGFPGVSEDKSVLLFEEFASEVNSSLDKYFSNRPSVKIIAEPGRFFANGSTYVFLKIINRRLRHKTYDTDKEEINQLLTKYDIDVHEPFIIQGYDYFVNQTTSLIFNLTILEGTHETLHTLRSIDPNELLYKSNVFGFSSVKNDQLNKDMNLPILEIGECIYYKNMGSYSTAYSNGSTFNGYDMGERKYYYKLDYQNRL